MSWGISQELEFQCWLVASLGHSGSRDLIFEEMVFWDMPYGPDIQRWLALILSHAGHRN